ncbi:hypothetical protein, partial [Streptococcus suis]|uniref:hypothetical protein n=1 Tax=Streptococcus suis TaxID=1307 RepID=UPI001EE3CBC9
FYLIGLLGPSSNLKPARTWICVTKSLSYHEDHYWVQPNVHHDHITPGPKCDCPLDPIQTITTLVYI